MKRYNVTCGHGCAFSASIDLDIEDDLGSWRPPTVSAVLGDDGEPIVTPWEGQPIEDVYFQHWKQVHQDAGQPPQCCFALDPSGG